MVDLFSYGKKESIIADGAVWLHGFALPYEDALLAAVEAVLRAAPLRHMVTPGGFRMSVGMTNCGEYGWVADRKAYRYSRVDPETGENWPAMPAPIRALGVNAAERAGYADFSPDACLINRYAVGAKLSMHRDENERDMEAPIVSISLGLPATFLFGGLKRTDKTQKILLEHGDVVVWGGKSRLFYHAVQPLKTAPEPYLHPLLAQCRINITLRKVIA